MTLLGKQLPKNSLNLMSQICEQTDPIFAYCFFNRCKKYGCEKLFELGFMLQISNSNIYCDKNGDDAYVCYNDNKPGYYEGDVWHEIDPSDLKQYRANLRLLISVIAEELNLSSVPEEIVPDYFWRVGTLKLKRDVPIFFARRVSHSSVFDKIEEALLKRKGTHSGIIFTTSKSLSKGFSFSEGHKVISLSDCAIYDSKNFHIDLDIVKAAIGAKNNEPRIGFSRGYRSAFFDNVEYIFTKKQAAILEVLDTEKKPMHKHELMIAADSEQDSPNNIFRVKGKYHEAWDKIIKFDGQGYYWLVQP